MSFFVDRSHLGSLPMTHMIMDEGEDSKGKSVKTDLSLVLNMFSFQSHFVCAKKFNIPAANAAPEGALAFLAQR